MKCDLQIKASLPYLKLYLYFFKIICNQNILFKFGFIMRCKIAETDNFGKAYAKIFEFTKRSKI